MFEGIKKIFETPQETSQKEKTEEKTKVAKDHQGIIKEEKEKKGEDWWREQP